MGPLRFMSGGFWTRQSCGFLRRRLSALIGLALLGLLLTDLSSRADTIRVTAWNLRAMVATNANWLPDAAGVLNQLSPDVLLLQGMPDWAACERLAELLTPTPYHVLICSAFPTQTNVSTRQTAILARHKAYVAWAEPWRTSAGQATGAGLAFSAIRFGDHRLGLFSLDCDSTGIPSQTIQQLLPQLETIKGWTTNQVQCFLLAFSSRTGSAPQRQQMLKFLQTAGLGDVVEQLQPGAPSTVPVRPEIGTDCLLADASVFALTARVSHAGCGSASVTCDFELDPVKAVAARLLAAERQASLRFPGNPSHRRVVGLSTGTALWAIPSSLLVLMGFVWFVARRRRPLPRPPALLPQNFETGPSTSYTVVVRPTPASTNAPVPRLSTGPNAGAVLRLEPPGVTHTQSAGLQERALNDRAEPKRVKQAISPGLLPDLRRWLKQILVRKLAVDRAHLLEAQQAATRKAMLVDERLARIEIQLQQQQEAYQRRIDELTRELLAAKEESRELIRARIAQVKTEMELARARVLAQARDESP